MMRVEPIQPSAVAAVDLARQRQHLIQQARVWAVAFRQADGDEARGVLADCLADELEAASIGDVRRVGDHLQTILDAWLVDSADAGTA